MMPTGSERCWSEILAAYNAGPNRIARLRKQAPALGLDPNRWFGNMEIVVLMHVGREPVPYVSNINRYYIYYKAMQKLLAEHGKALAATCCVHHKRAATRPAGKRTRPAVGHKSRTGAFRHLPDAPNLWAAASRRASP